MGNTAYSFDPVGNLTNITYPHTNTGNVRLVYDYLNRLTNMVDGVGTSVYTYDAAGQLLTEDGPFASDTVTNTYASRHRIALALQQPTGVWTNGFVWDVAGRLFSAKSPAGEFDYSYSALTPGFSGRLVNRLALPNSAYITNQFDPVARLTATILNNSGNSTLDSSTYVYNTAGQRTSFVNTAGASVQYTYDNIGQLYNAPSSVSGESRTYKSDEAWNTSPLSSNYFFDVKNELTNNGVNNLLFDANGNLTNNVVGYTFDDENRLTQASDDVQHTFRTRFAYDGLGRLRKRFDYTYGVPTAGPTGPFVLSTWYVTNTVLYVYDGWRVIQERDTNNNPQLSYTRGLDLSGTFEGAGGIGGLLAWSGQPGTFFYHADGNGNIMCLIGGNQAVNAVYRYDPYGNTTTNWGPMAAANTYRFSSKELMSASGLYYYGFRFYAPSLLRWVNRDPIGESGFRIAAGRTGTVSTGEPNNYLFVANNPISQLDPEGLILPPAEMPGRNGPVPSNPKPSKPCKRDCTKEMIECNGRGLVVCGAFEYLFPAKGPWPFRACMAAYSGICAKQKADCEQWNKDHGF